MTDAARQNREGALRRAVLTGDEAAWRIWYDETFDAVQRFVSWRLRGHREGEDEFLQETWLIAVKKIREFDPQRGKFVDWVRGIAANVLKNHLRQAHSLPLTSLDDAVLEAVDSTDARVASRSERIAEVLEFLPGRYAKVLQEKYLEQRSIAEIATSWNETTKAVESLLTRARQAFREAFGTDQS